MDFVVDLIKAFDMVYTIIMTIKKDGKGNDMCKNVHHEEMSEFR